MKIISRCEKDTLLIGRQIAKKLKKGDIVCLFGKFGSGKTVLTKGIASGLGVAKDSVISPSFVLIREYPDARIPLYHFDLYRLENKTDILALGYEGYLYGEGVSVIEWADRLGRLLPEEYIKIHLDVSADKKRKLLITGVGSRYAGYRLKGRAK